MPKTIIKKPKKLTKEQQKIKQIKKEQQILRHKLWMKNYYQNNKLELKKKSRERYYINKYKDNENRRMDIKVIFNPPPQYLF